jgi:hypothetical protein
MNKDKNTLLKFSNIANEVVIPIMTTVKSGNKYFYGWDNFYPYKLLQLFYDSPTHSSIIKAKTQGVLGQGVDVADETDLERYYLMQNQDLNTLVERTAFDYSLFNGFAIRVDWNVDGDMCHLSHLDFSGVRFSTDLDDYNDPCSIYFSRDWRQTALRENRVKVYPLFNPSKSKQEPTQIFVFKTYQAGGEMYPHAEYEGAMEDIIMERQIALFHLRGIQRNYSPTLLVKLKREMDDESFETMQQEFDKNYLGANNAGGVIYLAGGDADSSPDVVPISVDLKDGVYDTLDDKVVQKILAAHRVPSPSLVGIPSGAQLGGDSNQLVQSQLMFDRTVLSPMRNVIENSINTIFKSAKWKFGKVNIIPTEYNTEVQNNDNTNKTQEVIQ